MVSKLAALSFSGSQTKHPQEPLHQLPLNFSVASKGHGQKGLLF
jgi:hypothetical protein